MDHTSNHLEPAAEHTTDLSLADFRVATVQQWRQAVVSGEVSCVELVTSALTAAATKNQFGAFLHLDPEFALARADQLDSTLHMLRRSGGAALEALTERAPLLGLPTGFKDLVAVAGLPLSLGTRALPTHVPPRDHGLARRVHRAGAVSIGKTQVPEFGLPCYSENQLSAPARNPLSPDRTAGGSSGGGAAAVAAGILPLVPGNDGGGSVRIPAAACGLVGLKPGRGRIPDDNPSSQVQNLMTSGPMARTAQDAALLFDIMAGHRFSAEPARPGSREPNPASGPAQRAVDGALQHGLPPLNIGVTTASPFSPDVEIALAEDAVIALEEGIAALAAQGHRVQGVENGGTEGGLWMEGYHRNFQALWTSPLAELGLSEEAVERLEPLTQYFVRLARQRPAEDTQAAIAALQKAADSAHSVIEPWDLLMTPMLASAPPEIGWFADFPAEQNYIEQCRFTPYSSVVNILGLPAINVPVHSSRDGLSWSVHLIGKRGSEEQLLALAALLSQQLSTS